MKTFYRVKFKFIYNTRPKGIQVEALVAAESEDEACDILNKQVQNAISNPKKTTYVYSKEEDNYIPIITDAEEDDSRLISVEIISVKESTICCFWGNPDTYLYLAKIGAVYISFKIIQNIAIGANDFDEAYNIIKNAFKDPKYVAKQLISKKISDYDCNHATFDIYSIKRSKLSVIP